jgi:hypothetical protein
MEITKINKNGNIEAKNLGPLKNLKLLPNELLSIIS